MTTRRKAQPGRQDGRIYWHSNVLDSLIDAEQVQPHEQNPNNGDEDAVRESILTNGVYRHIYADRKTKRIIAGHTQYAVEIELQLEDGIQRPVVPVSFVDGRDRAHVLKMLSVDNAAARKARLDEALQLDLLRDLDGDLDGSGFDVFEMETMERRLSSLDDAELGELASDVSEGGIDLEDGQMVVSVVIESDSREAFYAVCSQLSYVIDTRDAR
jgi:hypothetical protein